MRTTLTLDDDLADRLKQLDEDRRQPFRQVVNAVVRRGLAAPPARAGRKPFKVQPFHSAFRPASTPPTQSAGGRIADAGRCGPGAVMTVPDVNVLIYACNEGTKLHAPARGWWERTLTSERPIGLPWAVVFGFQRPLHMM